MALLFGIAVPTGTLRTESPAAPNPAGEADRQYISIATGSISGLYYKIGLAFCWSVNKDRLRTGLWCGVEATQGSPDNLTRLLDNEVTFAIVQSDTYADFAAAGRRHDTNRLRVVDGLYVEPLHLFVSNHFKVTTLADFISARINIASVESGNRNIAVNVLHHSNIDLDALPLVEKLPSIEQVDAICNDYIDASFWVAGTPNELASLMLDRCDARLFNFDPTWVSSFLTRYRQYLPYVIQRETYLGLDTDITTFGPTALLVTRDDVSIRTVFTLLYSIERSHEQVIARVPRLKEDRVTTIPDNPRVFNKHPAALVFFSDYLGSPVPSPRPTVRVENSESTANDQQTR